MPAPADDTPAYEAVPDEIYDAYVPDDDDFPPFDDDDSGAGAPATGGAPSVSQDSLEAPAPAQTAVPGASGNASGEGDSGSAGDLAQLLSAGFGGFVKVSETD